MNILRHKKWHVRTKENVARVRRDEAKAEAEEKARAERAAIAENEDRVRRLKMRSGGGGGADASSTVGSIAEIFGPVASTSSAENEGATKVPDSTVAPSGHVNFFADLEHQERKNLGVGNKDYEAEKKKEQDDWESKMGIMKRFAEDTKEYNKERNWWEDIPLVREPVEKPAAKPATVKPSTSVLRPTPVDVAKKRKHNKEHKKKNKRKRRHRSSSSSSDSPRGQSSAKKKEAKLAKLRAERLERERREQLKAKELLAPKKEVPEAAKPKPTKLAEDRERKYNSQFNPEFARK